MAFLLGGGAKKSQSQQAPVANGLQVQTSVQGKPLALVYGQNRVPANLIWAGDFKAVTTQDPGADGGGGGKGSVVGGGGGKGGGTGTSTTEYFTSLAMSLAEGPIENVGKVWANNSQFANLSAAGFSLFNGGYSQSAWAYLTSNHPGQDLTYRGIAYVAAASLSLGGAPQLAQYSWEVFGIGRYNPGLGIVDAEPSFIISDLVSNVHYGSSPALSIYSSNQYTNYCVANGLFMSPILDAQETFANAIQRILALTNSTCAWVAPGQLKLIPYGDQTVTGNGVTFTPDLTPQYDLGDDDYYVPKGSAAPPVVCTRTNPADAYNQLILECCERSNDYNLAYPEWKDQGAIDLYGLKPTPSTVSGREFTSSAVGVLSAQLIGRRALYVRNQYNWQLPITYCRLEAGDLVTLTESGLGLVRQLVRLTNVDYGTTDDEIISLTAEEVNVGTAAPAAYASQVNVGYNANLNVSPGAVNAPIIFTAPFALTEGELEAWIGLSGSDPNFGGCAVWVSTDNQTYKNAGTFFGNSRMGVTTADLPQGADPDTVHTLSVNLSESLGLLTSGSQQDANLFNTLCYVDGELVSYTTATLSAANQYNLAPLRRGVWGSTIGFHRAGTQFLRVDDNIFKIRFPASFNGRQIFLKFVPFNNASGGMQDISAATAYPFTLSQAFSGLRPMRNISGLQLFNQDYGSANWQGQDVKFQWRQNSLDNSFDIGSEPFGASSGGLDPYFKDYEIRILDQPNGTVLRIEHTSDTYYTYTYEKNFEDTNGNPLRTLTINVYARGNQGQLSLIPATLTVTNPQPPLPTNVFLSAALTTVFLQYNRPPDTDWAGVLIFMSTTSGFTPSGTTVGAGNCVYDGTVQVAAIPALAATNYFLRYASYDTFGKTGLTYSGEISVTTGSVDIPDGSITTVKIADNAITAPKITANAVVAGKIAANAVQAGNIAADAVTAGTIAAGSVTAGKIAANAITGTEVSASAKITVGTAPNCAVLDGVDATYRLYVGNGTPASAPFSVKQDGSVTIKSATSGQRLELATDTVRVYDSGGTLRVKLGNLA